MQLSHESSEFLFNQNSFTSFDSFNNFEDDETKDLSGPSLLNDNFINSKPNNYCIDLSLNNIRNNENINESINQLQIQLKNLYDENQLDEIINFFENQNRNFFENNKSFLYVISKIKFFQMLKERKIEEAKEFYNNTLKNLLLKARKNEFEKKHQFFQKVMGLNVFSEVNLLDIYYKKFKNECNVAIKNYLGLNGASEIKKGISDVEMNINHFDKNYNDTRSESTKTDDSDFEINSQFCDKYEEEENKENENSNFSNNELFPEIKINNSNKIINNNENKNNNKDENLIKKLPFLSSFKAKYAKRETIDKKIIRNFKSFITKLYKKKQFDPNDYPNYSFFVNLVNENILPPIDYTDLSTNEHIHFKSFNTNFLLWFFSKEGIKELYNKFINIEGEKFLENISNHYKISEREKIELWNYLINLPFIFDISLVKFPDNGNFNHNSNKRIYINSRHLVNKNKLKKCRSRDLDNEI